jgi:NitT/TauT family transport system ATP-binding protein
MPVEPPLIALHQVDKRFDSGLLALSQVSLAVAAGEFVALLGPSGCGKSTVLRLVAGLDDASAGQVQAPALHSGGGGAGGRSGGAAKGSDTTAFVFQEPTLMPWATVFDNVWLPLRLQGRSRSEAASAVRAVLARVGLAEFERAHPAQLSGGMKMRTSIARALVTRPRVLLMDEPFAALDDITRQALNADLLRWWQPPGAERTGVTSTSTSTSTRPADQRVADDRMATLFVTHSVAEAVFLSQRVLVMAARPGRVVAELAIPQPYPREAGFRHTPAFVDACRQLGDALLQAHGATAPASATVRAPAAPR